MKIAKSADDLDRLLRPRFIVRPYMLGEKIRIEVI